MNRPKIKDYFAEKTDVKTVHNEYINSPHLYRYASDLDKYIDDLEDKLSERVDNTESLDNDEPKALIIDSVSKSLPLPAERWDAEELLNSKDVFNHPRVETRLNDDSFEVADLMAEFANKYYGNVC